MLPTSTDMIRNSGSPDLAKNLAMTAGFSENAFGIVFQQANDGTGATHIKPGVLVHKTVPMYVQYGPNHWNKVIPEFDFATAELFMDVFSSLAFDYSSIVSKVFSSTTIRSRIISYWCGRRTAGSRSAWSGPHPRLGLANPPIGRIVRWSRSAPHINGYGIQWTCKPVIIELVTA